MNYSKIIIRQLETAGIEPRCRSEETYTNHWTFEHVMNFSHPVLKMMFWASLCSSFLSPIHCVEAKKSEKTMVSYATTKRGIILGPVSRARWPFVEFQCWGNLETLAQETSENLFVFVLTWLTLTCSFYFCYFQTANTKFEVVQTTW